MEKIYPQLQKDINDAHQSGYNQSLTEHNLTDEQLDNTCLYIDEISSFLLLTHNSTLDNSIKNIYTLLIRLIKKCKKLIVTDAYINDQCFEIFNIRNGKKIFIDNTYKKYENVNAINIKNKEDLIDLLLYKCKNNSSDIRKKFYLMS
jgi:hypothetical protein